MITVKAGNNIMTKYNISFFYKAEYSITSTGHYFICKYELFSASEFEVNRFIVWEANSPNKQVCHVF
ncbi:hypothetical protein AB284_22305 [Enterobacter hormaechei]|nr:hypothetical protein ECNIH2_03590 [Enterobacter cloacae ECNIH2]AKK76775.1 hypothetical protein ABY62_08935 [Enterobacter hormaechei]KJM98248.1 hypothetical protein SS53_00595 [Enterobacter hormaechei subsp. steigerwaltii]AKL50110.1 hypothetical protein AB285_01520 [Enterobacter hormaechei]ANS19233.1 hypothetical protein AB284_22305 [Enterobacter hormaechei]